MTEKEINGFVEKFRSYTLTREAWTHQAHIIVAFWFNTHYDFDEAFAKVKANIKTYNESIGGQNTDTAGYHETITRFWMVFTKNYLLDNKELTLAGVCQKFFESEDSLKELPLKYYSAELLTSTRARKEQLKGDILVLNLTEA